MNGNGGGKKMFDGYRDLLKIICCKKWNTDENQEELEGFLNILEKSFGEKSAVTVLLNLLQYLLQKAFVENNEELLHLAINTIISLDELLEKKGNKLDEKIEDEAKLSVEKEKVSKEQTEEEDETLSENYGIHIKKSIVKEVLSKIKKDFSLGGLEEIIVNYYRNVLKSGADDKSLHVYTCSYIRFLTEFGLCKRDSVPKRPSPKKSAVIYHLTGKDVDDIKGQKKPEKTQKTIGRSFLSNKARYIILWAEKNATDIVDVDAVYKHKLHPIGENYRIKDIYAGLDELVEKGIATRFGKKRYTIKREMIKKE